MLPVSNRLAAMAENVILASKSIKRGNPQRLTIRPVSVS
jgi:hypothetical protein